MEVSHSPLRKTCHSSVFFHDRILCIKPISSVSKQIMEAFGNLLLCNVRYRLGVVWTNYVHVRDFSSPLFVELLFPI